MAASLLQRQKETIIQMMHDQIAIISINDIPSQ
jgi:hypothetical protein